MSEEAKEDLKREIILTSAFAIEFSGKESPSELFAQEQGITSIGDLGEVTSLRKVDISFNPISSLDKIQQLHQLRHLSAYCCRLQDIECLAGIKRIETLFLQQNGITSIPFGNSFNKLKELRLDRNQITSVTTLSGCSNLRSLNLSWNKLESLEGLGGLQNLQEINVSHNSLQNLKHLRALPSLVELDVSFNTLKDLNGLQLLPTLEVLHAENNAIATLSIPKTYFTHLNKELDKKGGGIIHTSGKGDGASVSESVASGHTSAKARAAAVKAPGAKSVGTSQASRKGSKASDASAAPSQGTDTVSSSEAIVGLQFLSELFLGNNQIKTLRGFEAFGVNLDTVDLSNNIISDKEGFILSHFSKLKKLNDVKLIGNRIPAGTLGDGVSSGSLQTAVQDAPAQTVSKSLTFEASLALHCPALQEMDGRAVVREGDKKNGRRGSNTVFHTWEDGSMSLADPTEVLTEGKLDDDVDEEAEPFSDDEEFMRQAEADAAEDYKKKNPHLVIETMLTREEVTEKEDTFRDLLNHTRGRLVEAVRSFVPAELQETGFDIEGLDLKKLEAAAVRDRQPSQGGKRESKSAGSKVQSRQSTANRSVASMSKNASLRVEEGRDEITGLNSSRPSSGDHDTALRRVNSDLSRASKLRSAVGSTMREHTLTDSSAIPRRIGATHVEASKKKPIPGRPPVGFDGRIKRDSLYESSGAGQVHSARLADETIPSERPHIEDKPNSARLDSDSAKTKRGVITERSSSFTFGDSGSSATSTSSVRVTNTTIYSKAPSIETEFPGEQEASDNFMPAALETVDGDKSIQWAPLSSTALSPSAPGEYVAEQYAQALKQGLETMESLNSALEWREMILNEDIKDWDDESVEQLQELFSPRYEKVNAAAVVPPPGSKDKGVILKSFRVPALQTELASKSTGGDL